MFGLVRKMFGMGEERADTKEDIVRTLEMAVSEKNCKDFVNSAERLRNVLRTSDRSLTNDEKVRIVRALNKAKVRALMSGTSESYSAFTCLESITSDVVQLL